MKRKDFFKTLLYGGSSLLVAGRQMIKCNNDVREIKLTSPYIAGFQFYEGESIEGRLKEKDSLTLKRQPDNKYDRYAIEVFHNGIKLGYMPRLENRIVARMMDQNVEVKGQVAKISQDSPPWQRVKIRVYYEMV